MKRFMAVIIMAASAFPAFADGDIEAGEKQFGKCKTCHSIVDDAGEAIQKGGMVGPNLYGVIGRQAGAYEDFRYGDDLVKAGEEGLVWDEALIAEYIADPKAFLVKTLDDKKARSKMAFKLPKGGEDVAAYLASVSPEADGGS